MPQVKIFSIKGYSAHVRRVSIGEARGWRVGPLVALRLKGVDLF